MLGPVAEIVQQTARIMRLVSFVGIVDEVGPSQYAANATTHLIITPAMIGGEKHQLVKSCATSPRPS